MNVLGRGVLIVVVFAGVSLLSTSHATAAAASGAVVSVDTEAKTISIKRRLRKRFTTVVYSVAQEAKITLNRKPATLSDLQMNDRVTVIFSAKSGKKTATKVTATRRKRKKS